MKTKICLLLLLLSTLAPQAFAKIYPYEYQYKKSIIYIFWTGPQDCYECEPTIELIKNTIANNFENEFGVYVVNYWQDKEYNYKEDYNLTSPLSVVMVDIEDGHAIKQKKFISETNVSDPYNFVENLKFQINNFFQ